MPKAAQPSFPLGQEGRASEAPSSTLVGAALGQEGRVAAPKASTGLGQEGQGLASLMLTQSGVMFGQEGMQPGGFSTSKSAVPAAVHRQKTADQEGQGLTGGPPAPEGAAQQWLEVPSVYAARLGVTSGQEGLNLGVPDFANGAAQGAVKCFSTATNLQDQLLFQPGVLEALPGAVAARLSASVVAVDATDENVLLKFSANKNHRQGQLKRMGKKEKKGRSESAEDARRIVIGKKREHIHDVPCTGSDLEFSFEKEMDSYEHLLYGDVSVSSKRVCTGRVERVKDVYGVVTHVAKELEEKEEEYVQQREESVGEEKEETGASAAFEEEVRRAK